MENQLITFETAKLAREKGFTILWDIKKEYGWDALDCQGLFEEQWYNKDGELRYIKYPGDEGLDSYITKENVDTTYLAPTQSLLQRWLREKHNTHITIKCKRTDSSLDGFWHIIYSMESKMFKTYEEALEDALYKSMILI